jgi:O-antigen ligase
MVINGYAVNATTGLNIKDYIGLILISVSIAAILSFIQEYVLIAALLLFIAVILLIYWEKIILGVIVISYLTTLTDYVGESRIVFNLLFTILLLYLFLKKYGLNYKVYPRLPVIIIIFLVLLFSTLVLSTIFSDYFLLGTYSIITSLLFFIIVYMFYGLIESKKDIYVIIISLAISVTIVAIRMFLDLYYLGFENYYLKVTFQGDVELYGSAGYTGYTIFFISATLLFSILIVSKFAKYKNKLFYIIIFFIHIFALIFSNSRALIVSAFISIGFILFYINRRMFYRVTGVLILMILLLITIPPVYNTIELYLRLDTVNQRDYLWQAGAEVISDNLIFGVGPRAFPNYFYSYAPSHIFEFFNLDIWKYGIPQPHNLFLYYWAENGILGFISIVTFFIVYFYLSVKVIKSTRNNNDEYFILALSAAGIGLGMLFRSFFEVSGILSYGYITLDLPFWLVVSILIFIHENGENKSHSESRNQFS